LIYLRRRMRWRFRGWNLKLNLAGSPWNQTLIVIANGSREASIEIMWCMAPFVGVTVCSWSLHCLQPSKHSNHIRHTAAAPRNLLSQRGQRVAQLYSSFHPLDHKRSKHMTISIKLTLKITTVFWKRRIWNISILCNYKGNCNSSLVQLGTVILSMLISVRRSDNSCIVPHVMTSHCLLISP